MRNKEKLDAIVISRRDIGESDRLVTFYTRSRGLLGVFANGVRKIPSRRGGHVEPLTRVFLTVTERGHRFSMQDVETIDHFPGVHSDNELVLQGRFASHVLLTLFEEGESEPAIFDAFLLGLERLPELTLEKRLIWEVLFLLRALSLAGVGVVFDSCGVCGRRVESVMALDATSGGVVCQDCRPILFSREAALLMNTDQARIAHFLSTSPGQAFRLAVDEAVMREVVRLVRQYCAYATESPMLLHHES